MRKKNGNYVLAISALFFCAFFPVPAIAQTQSPAKNAAKITNPFSDSINPDAAFLARMSGIFDVEDPSTLYDFSVSDKEVECVVDGTWEMNLLSTLSIDYSQGAPVLGYTPPVFTQIVNMTTWVFLDKTWYFESSFAEAFTKNTVAAGYVGNDDTVVKHVRVGNSGIVFPSDYPFVQIGGGKSIEPGVMGTFAGDNWNADAIVRYDAAATGSLELSGMNEINDTLVSVTAPLRGKWFVLPDVPVTGAVTVYVEDSDGSIVDAGGRHWRKLELAEYTVDGVLGVVELDTAATGSVAVKYGGTYTDTSTTGKLQEFIDDTGDYLGKAAKAKGMTEQTPPAASNYVLPLDGGTALLVRERGHFSPFDAGLRYLANGTSFELVYSESGIKPAGFVVESYESSYAELRRGDAADNADIRTPECRFPLAGEFPYLYLPSYGGIKPDTDLSIRSRTYTAVTSISLGSDVIPGTIVVTRNGIPDTAFRFDEDSGILQLDKMPGAAESIKIAWYKTDQSARNGTLTVAGGFRYRPSAPLELSLASALKWNTSKDGYTTYTDTSPGTYLVSTGAAWKTENLKASTAFAFEVAVPDTTGFYRINGMDTTGNTLYPASSWYETVSSSISPVLGTEHGAPGTTLAASSYVTPEGTDGTTPHTTTDSAVSGSVLVLKCNFTASGDWTAANVAIGTSGGADLSTARTLAIALKNPGSSANFNVYLQLGVKNGDNYEDKDTVRTWPLDTPAANSNWIIRTITLSDADRTALSAGNDLRLIVVPTGVPTALNPVAAYLCSGPVEVTESGFGADTPDIALTETSDPLTGSKSLASSQSEIINRFNSGSRNTVLEATLTPSASSEELRMSKTIPAIPFVSYKKFSFFFYSPSYLDKDSATKPDASSKIRITLSRPNSSGTGTELACSFEISPGTLYADSWHKVTLDLENERVIIDDSVLSPSVAPVYSLRHSSAPTKITVAFENWAVPLDPATAPAKIYFDEFYLEESSPVQTIRNQTSFAWKSQNPIFSIGKTAILSNPTIATNTVESTVVGQSEVYASGNAAAGVSILGARVDGTVAVANSTGRALEQATHTVSVPAGPLSANERFAADFAGETLTRQDDLALAGPIALSGSLGASQSDTRIERKAGFTVTPAIPRTPVGAFALSAGSAFTQSGKSPITDIEGDSWNDLWQNSFRAMLSNGESDASKRTGTTSVHTEWDSDGLILSAVKLDAEGVSTYAAGSATTIDSAVSYAWSFPLNFKTFSLTPGWKRTASERKALAAGGSWNTDSETLASSIPQQRWLFSVAPVADLFNPSIDGIIADNGTWSRTFSNAYSLDWQRPSPGLLSDLWTPVSVTMAIKRETETDATASNVRDIWTASARAGFSALNIAGSQGVLHVFPWYEQDEISQLYGWTPKWGTGFFVWSADAWHAVTLFFTNSGSIAAENTWHYDSPDISGKNELARDALRLVWKRPGKSSPIIGPLMRITKLPLSTRREDSFTWSITLQKNAKTETRSYDHLLATGIGKNGELRISAGAETTSTEEGLQNITIKLGVGGKLTY
jgi:hypothetical protein